MTNLVANQYALDIILKLGAALICGALIGTERIIAHKDAGMRTYALVAMGSALFVVVGDLITRQYLASGISVADPLQIPSMIISGIGFLGAGVIIFRNNTTLAGLTTASGLWVAAAIGMACGFGYYVPAFLATLLCLFTLIVLWRLEQGVKKIATNHESIAEAEATKTHSS